MVYFIKSEMLGLIKIGYCTDGKFKSRFCQLRVSSPDNLLLMGLISEADRNYEKSLHVRFKYLRVRGEWFSPGEDLVNFINQNKEDCDEMLQKAKIRELKESISKTFERRQQELPTYRYGRHRGCAK